MSYGKYCHMLLVISFTAAPNPPSDFEVLLINISNTLSVSWTPPSGGLQPTKYIIYYSAIVGEADTGIMEVTNSSISHQEIPGRDKEVYTVRIVALSNQLPSIVVEQSTETGESSGADPGLVRRGGPRWSTVKPLLADPPKSGQSPYSGQASCPRLIFP